MRTETLGRVNPSRGLLLCLAWLAACGSSPLSITNDGGSTTTSGKCKWPVSLDLTDASDGRCRAMRAFLSCTPGVTSGAVTCLSSDLTRCSDLDTDRDASFACQDYCASNEYGAACGTNNATSGPTPNPPEGCWRASAPVGNVVFYCCPCGD